MSVGTHSRGGPSIVEVGIVVAIVAMLSALATRGVSRYVVATRAADAKATIVTINRHAAASVERAAVSGERGAKGADASERRGGRPCGSAMPVPAMLTQVTGRSYRPVARDGVDYRVGNGSMGWPCLRYESSDAQWYQFSYSRGAAAITSGLAFAVGREGWVVEAAGDVDGNGVPSAFLVTGAVVDGQPSLGTAVLSRDSDE